MSNFKTFSDNIVSLLTNLVDSDSNKVFTDVKTIPTIIFKGWPAATVVPSSSAGDYASIEQNLRVYTFFVDIHYVIQQETNGGYQAAFDTMLPLVDQVLDAIDNSDDLGQTAAIVTPAPSSWGMVEGNPGTVLRARVNVQCKILTSQNNG